MLPGDAHERGNGRSGQIRHQRSGTFFAVRDCCRRAARPADPRSVTVMKAEKSDSPVVVKDLRKSFDQQKVLDGVNLEIAHGETVSVLGRSGTGKSVLLRLLIRLQEPDS